MAYLKEQLRQGSSAGGKMRLEQGKLLQHEGHHITEVDAATGAKSAAVIRVQAVLLGWDQFLLSCYTTAAKSNMAVGILICLALTIPVSLTLLLLILVVPFLNLWIALASPDKGTIASPEATLGLLGCLDAFKVCSMRSFSMALFETPAFLAYSTVGFCNPLLVGKYSSVWVGVASMIGGMLHIVLETQLLQSAAIKAGGLMNGIRKTIAVGLHENAATSEVKRPGRCCQAAWRVMAFLLACVLAGAAALVIYTITSGDERELAMNLRRIGLTAWPRDSSERTYWIGKGSA
jgi:hypothetical protein